MKNEEALRKIITELEKRNRICKNDKIISGIDWINLSVFIRKQIKDFIYGHYYFCITRCGSVFYMHNNLRATFYSHSTNKLSGSIVPIEFEPRPVKPEDTVDDFI